VLEYNGKKWKKNYYVVPYYQDILL
jgi:hypothetical protein